MNEILERYRRKHLRVSSCYLLITGVIRISGERKIHLYRVILYATNRKVSGSNPDEVIAFLLNLFNPSTRTMALGSTRPRTEMSNRNLTEG
jgi:hypothetical protein